MGYRVGEVCYSTSSEAVDAWFSGAKPYAMLDKNGFGLEQFYSYAGGVWHSCYSGVSGAIGCRAAVVPGFAVCSDPSSAYDRFMDGQALGWGVVGACCLVLFVRWAREHIR